MPVLGTFVVSYMYTTAVLTATLEESKIDVTGAEADARIQVCLAFPPQPRRHIERCAVWQGGLTLTAVMSFFAVLATGIPVVPIAENNAFISSSKVASRMAGIMGAIILLLFGLFGHLLALIDEMPLVIKGAIIATFAANIVQCGLRVRGRDLLSEILFSHLCGF